MRSAIPPEFCGNWVEKCLNIRPPSAYPAACGIQREANTQISTIADNESKITKNIALPLPLHYYIVVTIDNYSARFPIVDMNYVVQYNLTNG